MQHKNSRLKIPFTTFSKDMMMHINLALMNEKKIFAVIYATYAVVKRKPEKSSGFPEFKT